MKKFDRCSVPEVSPDCHTPQVLPTGQPFPKFGLLANNSNLPLAILSSRFRKVRDETYS